MYFNQIIDSWFNTEWSEVIYTYMHKMPLVIVVYIIFGIKFLHKLAYLCSVQYLVVEALRSVVSVAELEIGQSLHHFAQI